MKRFGLPFTALLIGGHLLASDPPNSKARSIYCHNFADHDTIEVFVALDDGASLRALESFVVPPAVDQLLVTGVYEQGFVYYWRYRGRKAADYQNSSPDSELYRFTPPITSRGDRIYADRNGANAEKWVFGHPAVFAPEDTAYIIMVTEPSYCKGRCGNGKGTALNWMEFFDITWVDSLPHGKGRLVYGDTVIVATWNMGVLHGPCTITFGRVREASGEFQDGLMHGPWIFEDKTRRGSYRYQYNMGKLHGPQEQRIDGVVTRGHYFNGDYHHQSSNRVLKTNLRKR